MRILPPSGFLRDIRTYVAERPTPPEAKARSALSEHRLAVHRNSQAWLDRRGALERGIETSLRVTSGEGSTRFTIPAMPGGADSGLIRQFRPSRLVIVGEQMSGKSRLLHMVAASLASREQAYYEAPVALLDLGSFHSGIQDLQNWLESELRRATSIASNVASALLAEGRFGLLLDAADEFDFRSRDQFLLLLDDYLKVAEPPFVVVALRPHNPLLVELETRGFTRGDVVPPTEDNLTEWIELQADPARLDGLRPRAVEGLAAGLAVEFRDYVNLADLTDRMTLSSAALLDGFLSAAEQDGGEHILGRGEYRWLARRIHERGGNRLAVEEISPDWIEDEAGRRAATRAARRLQISLVLASFVVLSVLALGPVLAPLATPAEFAVGVLGTAVVTGLLAAVSASRTPVLEVPMPPTSFSFDRTVFRQYVFRLFDDFRGYGLVEGIAMRMAGALAQSLGIFFVGLYSGHEYSISSFAAVLIVPQFGTWLAMRLVGAGLVFHTPSSAEVDLEADLRRAARSNLILGGMVAAIALPATLLTGLLVAGSADALRYALTFAVCQALLFGLIGGMTQGPGGLLAAIRFQLLERHVRRSLGLGVRLHVALQSGERRRILTRDGGSAYRFAHARYLEFYLEEREPLLDGRPQND